MMRCVLLIHGFLTNEHDFDNLIPSLEPLYDYIHLYIAPGHETPPNYREFTVDETFKTLLDCYDELSLKYDEIDVIGFSMGGALATYLQSVRIVDRLVLLAPANRYMNFQLFHSRMKYIASSKQELKRTKQIDPKVYEFIQANLDALAKDDKKALEIGFKQLFPHYSLHNLSTFMTIIKRCNQELISIDTPVLIIWGKLDQFVPEASIDFLEDLIISSSKVVKVDNLSHLMLRSENYQYLVDLILDFLKRKEEQNNEVN